MLTTFFKRYASGLAVSCVRTTAATSRLFTAGLVNRRNLGYYQSTNTMSSQIVPPFMMMMMNTETNSQSVKTPIMEIITNNHNITNGVSIDGIITSEETMRADSVMRKRRKKMKKHKLRKRRKAQRALKRKLAQG
ncbi:hypothetical protein DASC09_052590 [Saccharomycopsis crataegensis]|uniref:Small ribosomal subunit protein mS38 n=1 Tax=Saccharomycopsis crataegensis TaxID=43959 RepID=A0AAV5QTV2_9ASCO|nr:hypothetical protein DASC09_052590 [Saccharomycopsis crataegensis]